MGSVHSPRGTISVIIVALASVLIAGSSMAYSVDDSRTLELGDSVAVMIDNTDGEDLSIS